MDALVTASMDALATARTTVLTTARRLVEGMRLAGPRRRSSMRVDKLMSSGVKTCSPEHSLTDAAKIMWEQDCGCVPVLDPSRRVIGMITDRDICMSAHFKGRALRDISIGEAMTRDILSVRPDDTVQNAEGLMRRVQVRRLPVVDFEGRLLGMLSLNDIALAAEREQWSTRSPEVDLREVALTLSAVSRQRSPVERHPRSAGASS